MNSDSPVLNLIAEITSALSARQGPLIVEQTLSCLAEMDFTADSMLWPDPSMPDAFANDLDVAIKHIPPQLSSLASAIDASKYIVQWNRDLGQFYIKDADVGGSYRTCKLCTGDLNYSIHFIWSHGTNQTGRNTGAAKC